ncbi:MAG: glutamine hydrolyzing CTP synthase, partial [Candidatus Woesearchaeota archaeon]
MERKYIIVTGGVISGLGKGIAAASIGHLLSCNYKVIPIKCDGYLNVDPGTMNPVEHGEVFVLDDGTEVDMDFGHYERFLNTVCTGKQNLTMGKVFYQIHELEREGKFLGQTVQLIPHVSRHIQKWWEELGKQQNADIVLIEIGGTVGDMENELYLEAARNLRQEKGSENVLFIHLTYVPIPGGVDEQKSKPTQQSVKLLMERGIFPGMILGRCPEMLQEKIKRKISLFANIDVDSVFSAPDVDSVYKLPQIFAKQNLIEALNKKLNLPTKPICNSWTKILENKENNKNKETIKVGICGKYTALEDSYASVVEAIHHASANNDVKVEIHFMDTEKYDEKKLEQCDAIIVPGGFGSRGVEGKIQVIKYCRENNKPFLGICYGLQLAVTEFARNICNLEKANSTEIDKETKNPVIDILPDKKDLKNMGGTLRLGAYDAILKKGTKIFDLYKNEKVSERHRHRYEVNPEYHKQLTENGLLLSGLSPDGRLVEFIE